MSSYMKTIISGLKQWVSTQKSDWNQNDPNAVNYVKHRTHYVETVEIKLLSDKTINDPSDSIWLESPMVKGITYTVVFKGTTYQCVAKEYDGYIMIGNNALYQFDNGNETDTGEPFAIECQMGSLEARCVFDDSVTEPPVISISCVSEVVHKLDKKFVDMPDGIVTEDDVHNILDEELAPVAFSNDYRVLNNRPTVYSDVVRYASQSLSDSQKEIARNNINALDADRYTEVVIDKNLSTTSTNAIRNATVTAELNRIKDAKTDWNQSDETAIDYMKNKPFYEYVYKDPVTITNSPVATTLNDTTGYYTGTRSGGSLALTVGAVYHCVVYFVDGNSEYTTVCKRCVNRSGSIYKFRCILGNPMIAKNAGIVTHIEDGSEIVDSGERWCFVAYEDTAMNAIYSTESGVRVSSLYLVTTELKTIDPKFLPEMGGGLPSGNVPLQQLVTDAEGNAVWEDKLCYQKQAFEPIELSDKYDFSKCETFTANGTFYKVADHIPLQSASDLDRYVSELYKAGRVVLSHNLPGNENMAILNEHGWSFGTVSAPAANAFVSSDGQFVDGQGTKYPRGLWFGEAGKIGPGGAFTGTISLIPANTVKTIDPKFLPETAKVDETKIVNSVLAALPTWTGGGSY